MPLSVEQRELDGVVDPGLAGGAGRCESRRRRWCRTAGRRRALAGRWRAGSRSRSRARRWVSSSLIDYFAVDWVVPIRGRASRGVRGAARARPDRIDGRVRLGLSAGATLAGSSAGGLVGWSAGHFCWGRAGEARLNPDFDRAPRPRVTNTRYTAHFVTCRPAALPNCYEIGARSLRASAGWRGVCMRSRPPVARRPWMAGGMGTDGVGTAKATGGKPEQPQPSGRALPAPWTPSAARPLPAGPQ